MKTVLFLLLLSPLAYGVTCATHEGRDEATLVHLEETWAHAEEHHDFGVLGCLLAQEFEEAGATGELIDRAQMLAEAAARGNVHLQLSELHAHVHGDFAYLRGVGEARQDNQPEVKTRFTDIFVYRERRWQCVAGHESRFPDSSP